MKYRGILIFLLVTMNIFCISSTEYWNQIKARADKLYKGVDLNFVLNLSVGENEEGSSGTQSKASVTVPL